MRRRNAVACPVHARVILCPLCRSADLHRAVDDLAAAHKVIAKTYAEAEDLREEAAMEARHRAELQLDISRRKEELEEVTRR